MRILKKLLCFILIASIISSICSMEVSALFGHAHFGLGKKMIDNSAGLSSLSDSEKNAFLSGIVYADIGRFKFDKKTKIESDSTIFADKMDEFPETLEEKAFVLGFRAHIWQDNETGIYLSEILGRKSSSYEYLMNCALVDSYFLRENGVLYNEFLDGFDFDEVTTGLDFNYLSEILKVSEDKVKNCVIKILDQSKFYPNKYSLTLYVDLIQKTYKSFGFDISTDEIRKQASNVVGAFIVSAFIASKKEIPEGLFGIIETKSDEFARRCLDALEVK